MPGMPRVLHIIELDTPRDCLEQLAMLAGPDDAIASVGPPPQLPQLGPAGLKLPVRVVHAPMGSAALAGRRREMKELARAAEAIHAWSVPAAAAGEMAADAQAVLLTLPHVPAGGKLRAVLKGLSRRAVRVTVPTEAAARVLKSAGADEEVVHVVAPPAGLIDPSEAARRRSRVRQALNLSEKEQLISAPGEMTVGSGHKYASWVHAILRRIFPGVRLIMPGGGRQLANVESFVASTGYAGEQHMTGEEFALADVLAASDMAVFFHERDCGVMGIAAAMAAALAIATTPTADAVECVGGDQAAVLVPARDPRAGSTAATRFITDRDFAGRLGEAAKERARRLFDPQNCRTKLDEIYAKLRQ